MILEPYLFLGGLVVVSFIREIPVPSEVFRRPWARRLSDDDLDWSE